MRVLPKVRKYQMLTQFRVTLAKQGDPRDMVARLDGWHGMGEKRVRKRLRDDIRPALIGNHVE